MEKGKNIRNIFVDERDEIVGKIPTAWLMRSNAAIIGILAMMFCLGVFLPYTLSGHIVWKDDHLCNGKYRVRLNIDSFRLSYGHAVRLLPEMTGWVEIVINEEPAICKVLPFTKRFLKAKSTNME